MPAIAIYAAILAVIYVGLSARVIRLRGKLRIGVGDGGNPTMLRAMRVHANFAEYVPLAVLLIFLMESGGANRLLVNMLGITLVLGRLAHGYGVSQPVENFRFRIAGMVLTFATMIVAALYIIGRSISG